MTENQQLMWDILCSDPKELCHIWAQDIMKSTRYLHRRADRYLGIALKLFSANDTARMLKTWLTDYRMPLDPDKLKNFDLFHETCGKRIALAAKEIDKF
jgi:hypothetical protein